MNNLEKAQKILAGICLECDQPVTDHAYLCPVWLEYFSEQMAIGAVWEYSEETEKAIKNGGWHE